MGKKIKDVEAKFQEQQAIINWAIPQIEVLEQERREA
jgi:hypothetical protein